MSNSSKLKRKISVAVGCLCRTNPQFDKAKDNLGPSFEFLLAKRRDRYIPELDNKWELPGGKVEQGEKPEECVAREILEETGYQVKVLDQLERVYTYVRKYPDFTQYTSVTCYQCELSSSQRRATQPDSKIEEVRWVDPDEIDYRQTLQGSREFIVDVAKSLGVRIEAHIEKTSFLMVFQVLRPSTSAAKERMGRRYVMNIQFDTKTNEYLLITHRGGKKHYRLQPKVEVFPDYESMISQAKKRARVRHYHGYSITRYDDDFPLLEWMRNRNFPFELAGDDTAKDSAIQLVMPLD